MSPGDSPYPRSTTVSFRSTPARFRTLNRPSGSKSVISQARCFAALCE